MIAAILKCTLPFWFLLLGGTGRSAAPVLDASTVIGSIDRTLSADHVGNKAEFASAQVINSFYHFPGEDNWSAPELFFESEEELREHRDPEEDTERERSIAGATGYGFYRPLVHSINDPSAVVGRGRHFNAAPPMHILLGVLRV